MCEICSEIVGDEGLDLIAQMLGGDYRRRVLAESEAMAVLPSIGPLVLGHVLICPRRHVNRLASLQEEEAEALAVMKVRVCEVLFETYGHRPQFFEHGASADGQNVPCTVSHAHLHAVPVPSIWDDLPQSLRWETVEPTLASISVQAGNGEYLYYEDQTGRAVIANSQNVPIESQLLRRVIAKAVGNSAEWNWRLFPNVDHLQQTYVDLESAFSRADFNLVAVN